MLLLFLCCARAVAMLLSCCHLRPAGVQNLSAATLNTPLHYLCIHPFDAPPQHNKQRPRLLGRLRRHDAAGAAAGTAAGQQRQRQRQRRRRRRRRRRRHQRRRRRYAARDRVAAHDTHGNRALQRRRRVHGAAARRGRAFRGPGARARRSPGAARTTRGRFGGCRCRARRRNGGRPPDGGDGVGGFGVCGAGARPGRGSGGPSTGVCGGGDGAWCSVAVAGLHNSSSNNGCLRRLRRRRRGAHVRRLSGAALLQPRVPEARLGRAQGAVQAAARGDGGGRAAAQVRSRAVERGEEGKKGGKDAAAAVGSALPPRARPAQRSARSTKRARRRAPATDTHTQKEQRASKKVFMWTEDYVVHIALIYRCNTVVLNAQLVADLALSRWATVQPQTVLAVGSLAWLTVI